MSSLCLVTGVVSADMAWMKINPTPYDPAKYALDSVSVDDSGGLYWNSVRCCSNRDTLQPPFYHTVDAGKTWDAVNPRLPYLPLSIQGRAFRMPGGRLFCVGSGTPDVLLQSGDLGATWTMVGEGFQGDYLSSMLGAGTGGHILYFVSKVIAASHTRDVLVSKDLGLHWTHSTTTGTGAVYLAVQPNDDAYLWAPIPSGKGTLWRTRDSGATWDSIYHEERPNAPIGLTAGARGAVLVLAYNDVLVDRPHRVPAHVTLTGNGSLVTSALTPDGGLVASFTGGSKGAQIMFSDSGYANWTPGNGTGVAGLSWLAYVFLYDPQGNLYAQAKDSVFALRTGSSAINPVSARGPFKAHTNRKGYDLQGRWSPSSQPVPFGWLFPWGLVTGE